jgi:hypothetical protein
MGEYGVRPTEAGEPILSFEIPDVQLAVSCT